MVYYGQLMIVFWLFDCIVLQFMLGYIYWNVVFFEDENGLFFLGVGMCLQISWVFGVIVDVILLFLDYWIIENGFYFVLGLGLEIDFGGYFFQFNFINVIGIMEMDFIFYIIFNWLDGEFCFGFIIFCLFNF